MAHLPQSSDLDLFPAFYQLLNDDMAASSSAGFNFPPSTFDLVVPPVDAHNDLYIQQQLVGDEDDDVVEEIQGPLKSAKRAKQGLSSPTESAASASSMAKVRAACSNCRSSHVACSHEIPCKRCVEHGLADSCQYLPRKKRTNFKKRKMHAIKEEDDDDADSNSNGSLVDSEAAIKMEEMRRNPPANLFEGGQPDQGLWNATLHQLFGNEYAFPLVNTNIPPQSQPKDYGLPLLPSSVSPYMMESPESSSPFDADNNWLSQLIGDSSPATSSTPTSPAEESQRSSALSSPDTSLVHNTVAQQRSWLKNSGGMMQLAPMPTVGHSGVARMPSQVGPPVLPHDCDTLNTTNPASYDLSPGSCDKAALTSRGTVVSGLGQQQNG